MGTRPEIWTVGHSNLKLEEFLVLLEKHKIRYVVDTRSHPSSRYVPHFNRRPFERSLKAARFGYLYLGGPLGGKPSSSEFLDDEGHALYGLMAQQDEFIHAINRLQKGAKEHRIAILCSCGKPDACHRRLLVGRVLAQRGLILNHISSDGSVTSESEVPLGIGEHLGLFSEDEFWRSAKQVVRTQG